MAASGTPLSLGILAEQDPEERRVTVAPLTVARLAKSGWSVLLQSGAGTAAGFTDGAYLAAGATLAARVEIVRRCDVLPVFQLPRAADLERLHPGQLVIGLIDPLNNLDVVSELAAREITLVALDLLPRTLSRAQSMDALSSQASAAGYRAAIVAAEKFGRYLPMMITASGTATPAKAIVIGTGVAGLQAIATLKRLGAVVTGYDVRPASRGEVESLGARFLTSTLTSGAGEGGYARALSDDERAAQQQELATALTDFDVIVTTARVPGHTPPVLVSAATLASLKAGSVCVDLGASEHGGNVVGSVVGRSLTTDGGVIVVGAGNLAADLPTSASEMYGRNILAALESLAPAGVIAIDPSDEVHSAIVVCHDGDVTSPAIRAALDRDPLPVRSAPEKAHA